MRPYFGVCASLCMSDVCAMLPSGCAFSVMRKRLYDNAKEPLPHLRSAFSVASYSLSGHAIKPLPSLLMPVGRSRETFSGCRKGFSACSAFLFRDFPLSKFFTAGMHKYACMCVAERLRKGYLPVLKTAFQRHVIISPSIKPQCASQ